MTLVPFDDAFEDSVIMVNPKLVTWIVQSPRCASDNGPATVSVFSGCQESITVHGTVFETAEALRPELDDD